MSEIRLIDLDKDYDMICSWWAHYKYPILSKDELSTTGFIVNDSYAVWVYFTNSKMCLIENAIKNPSKELSDDMLSNIFQFLKTFCANQGYTSIMSFSLNKHFIERLKSIGFKCSEKQVFVLTNEVM